MYLYIGKNKSLYLTDDKKHLILYIEATIKPKLLVKAISLIKRTGLHRMDFIAIISGMIQIQLKIN